MINFTLKDGAPLDIPEMSIILVEELTEGKKGCGILYQLDHSGTLYDELKDAFGFVKKKWLEANPQIINPLEITISGESPRKLCITREHLVAIRGLTKNPEGANSRVTFNLGGKTLAFDVLDKRDSIIGE